MISLTVPFPPSFNTYWRRGRYATYLSQNGRDYRDLVASKLAELVKEERYPLDERVAVTIILYRGDKRRYDVDNYIKSILDAICFAGVLADDELVDRLEVERGPIRPRDGSAEVTIEPR